MRTSTGHTDARPGFGAGGFDVVAGEAAKDFPGGAAAPFVAAADEEELLIHDDKLITTHVKACALNDSRPMESPSPCRQLLQILQPLLEVRGQFGLFRGLDGGDAPGN